MRPFLRCALLIAFGLAPLPAQSRVVIPTTPYTFDSIEGDTFVASPGRFAPGRGQFFYNRSAMPPGPLLIRSFKARGDGARNFSGGHAHAVEVLMSTPSIAPGRLSSLVWDANHGPDATVVIGRLNVNYPGLSGASPERFQVLYPLDRPFSWPGGAFTLDIVTFGTTLVSNPYYLDAQAYGGFTPPPAGSRIYSGKAYPSELICRADPVGLGGLVLFQGATGIPWKKVPVMILLGASEALAGPVLLPHDLAPYGAKGCTLYTDPAAILAGSTDPASARGAFEILQGFLPLDPILEGAVFYDQALCFEASLNPLGLGSSALAKNTIGGVVFGGNYDCMYIFSYAASGSYLWTGSEPVARFFAGKGLIVELGL